MAAGELVPIMICSNTRPLLLRSEDLIFPDVRLRGVMEGIDLARKVKMRCSLLPVILYFGTSARASTNSRPVSYMSKPLQPLNRCRTSTGIAGVVRLP